MGRENNAYGFLCELVCKELSEFQYEEDSFYLKKLMINSSKGRILNFRGLIDFLQGYPKLDDIRDLLVYLSDEKANGKKIYHLPDFIVKRVRDNKIEEVSFIEAKKYGAVKKFSDVPKEEKRALRKLNENGYPVLLMIIKTNQILKEEDVEYLLKLESEYNKERLLSNNISVSGSKIEEKKPVDKFLFQVIANVDIQTLRKY